MGIALTVVGLVICFFTSQIKLKFAVSDSDVGPRLFPYISGIGITICGILVALTAKKDTEDKEFLDSDGWKRLGLLVGLLILYVIAIDIFGFLISTPVALFFLILLLADKKKLRKFDVLVISIISTGLAYLLFEKLLHVMLPRGLLFR